MHASCPEHNPSLKLNSMEFILLNFNIYHAPSKYTRLHSVPTVQGFPGSDSALRFPYASLFIIHSPDLKSHSEIWEGRIASWPKDLKLFFPWRQQSRWKRNCEIDYTGKQFVFKVLCKPAPSFMWTPAWGLCDPHGDSSAPHGSPCQHSWETRHLLSWSFPSVFPAVDVNVCLSHGLPRPLLLSPTHGPLQSHQS